MASEFEFHVDSLAQGRVTPRALLDSTGTISAPFIREFLSNSQFICVARLAGAGWFFNIGYRHGYFIVERNGGKIALGESWCRDKILPENAVVSWTIDHLIVSFGDLTTHWNYPQCSQPAIFVPPPMELVKWVRQQELSSVELFETEDAFVRRVHSSLQRFEERIGPILTRDIFWDVARKGNRITSRKPKREVDVQSAIHAMLIDHMQLSSIDIFPEVKSSAGAVDFLLQGPLKDGGVAKICVEFKNAHSPDLISGLTDQLRSYMQHLEISNGAYCILDYRDSTFRQPKASTDELLAKLEEADKPHSKWPNRPIKVHWFKIGADNE